MLYHNSEIFSDTLFINSSEAQDPFKEEKRILARKECEDGE